MPPQPSCLCSASCERSELCLRHPHTHSTPPTSGVLLLAGIAVQVLYRLRDLKGLFASNRQRSSIHTRNRKTPISIFDRNPEHMDTVLIASFHSKKEADAAAVLLKKLTGTVRTLNSDHWDDLLLGKMIDDGMTEEGELELETLRAKLRK
jgi:hypothetical protein